MVVRNEVMQSVGAFIAALNTPGSAIQQQVTNLEIEIANRNEAVRIIFQQILDQAQKLEAQDKAQALALLELTLRIKDEDLRDESNRQYAEQTQKYLEEMQNSTSWDVTKSDYENLCTQRDIVSNKVDVLSKQIVTAINNLVNSGDAIHKARLDELNAVLATISDPELDKVKANIIKAFENAPNPALVIAQVGSQYNAHTAAVTDVIRVLTSGRDEEEEGYVDPLAMLKTMSSKFEAYTNQRMSQPSLDQHQELIDTAITNRDEVVTKLEDMAEAKAILSSLNSAIDRVIQLKQLDVDESEAADASEWDYNPNASDSFSDSWSNLFYTVENHKSVNDKSIDEEDDYTPKAGNGGV